ncbi:MAG: SGNH/GDSL hydrolase family protein [Eubacteriales bacterium]
MNITDYYFKEGEKPLDNIVTDGGFCGIFRKIACIGDSLSSGEFEGTGKEGEKTFHDFFDYSWGQYLARLAGTTVYNFSRGGMSAKEYCETFAEKNMFWNKELAAQAYIIALGANDTTHMLAGKYEFGSLNDICDEDYTQNKPTFVGWYAQIIQRYKALQPDAKFFLMTMPRSDWPADPKNELRDRHSELLYAFAEKYSNTYVLDLRKYAPVYDKEFRRNFYLAGHMNAAGYMITAKMVASYIDYLIRKYPDDFRQVGFIGTPFSNKNV